MKNQNTIITNQEIRTKTNSISRKKWHHTMYNIEYEASEQEVLSLILEAVHDEDNSELRELIIDPIISIIEKPVNRNRYIEYGNTFLEANAEMLSKEYPTKAVSFPKRYIDDVFSLFGFDMEGFSKIIKGLISKHISKTNNFATILNNPSNVIHAIVLYYSDMILNRKLRDSARQQLGLSIYNNLYKYKYSNQVVDEQNHVIFD